MEGEKKTVRKCEENRRLTEERVSRVQREDLQPTTRYCVVCSNSVQ